MPNVIGAKNLTDKRFLNMYELEVEKRDGSRRELLWLSEIL